MITYWIKAKDGKEYAIRFTNGLSIQLASEEGIPSNQIQKFLQDFASWPIRRVYRYYYLAFKKGAKAEGREFEIDEDDFIDFLFDDDTIMPQVIQRMSDSFPEPAKKKEIVRKVK